MFRLPGSALPSEGLSTKRSQGKVLSNATAIIDRAIDDFATVLRVLGFERKRGNRAACVICGAINTTTFSYKPDVGIWNCFRCGRGGGVLDLVEAVHRCDRRESLLWLADLVRVPLDDHSFSRSERRAWVDRRRWAEQEADDLDRWRTRLISDLRARRNDYWGAERHASAWALNHLNGSAMADDWRWEAVWTHAFDRQRGDALDELIEEIERASPAELLAMRAKFQGVAE